MIVLLAVEVGRWASNTLELAGGEAIVLDELWREEGVD